MADKPAAPFRLTCAWCEFFIVVNARGQRGDDPGSGVEAAYAMRYHVEGAHSKGWAEYLRHTDLPTRRPA